MKMRCWLGLMLVCAVSASAQVVPSSFNYQGVLRGGAGQFLGPVAKNVTFKLYHEPTQGVVVWGRTCAVLLDSNGLFNVELSDANGSKLTAPPAAVDAALTTVLSSPPSSLYLGVTVEGANEIAPRQQLLSVPFAMMAGNVKQAGDLTVNGTLTVTNGMVAGPGLTLVSPNKTASLEMKANEAGEIVMPSLRVTGNANVAGNAALSQNLTVAGNTVLNGNTTVNGSTVLNGSVQVFSTNRIVNYNNSGLWTSQTPFTLVSSAASDGFIIINVSLYLDTQYAYDETLCKFVVSFSGVPNNTRQVEKQLFISNADTKFFSVTDVITLPYLKGETIEIAYTSTGNRTSSATGSYKYYCLPFGVTK